MWKIHSIQFEEVKTCIYIEGFHHMTVTVTFFVAMHMSNTLYIPKLQGPVAHPVE